MKEKKIIGIDFDDVLLNFNDSLLEYHNANYGTTLARHDCVDFDLTNIWKCTGEENMRRMLEFYETEMHWNSPPVSEAQESVRKLRETHELVVITSRPERLKERTLKWLENYFPNTFEHVFFTNQFSGNENVVDKATACKRFKVNIFIDDHIDNAVNVADNGIDAYLFDTPWNQKAPEHPKITRVFGWPDILKKLTTSPIYISQGKEEAEIL